MRVLSGRLHVPGDILTLTPDTLPFKPSKYVLEAPGAIPRVRVFAK